MSSNSEKLSYGNRNNTNFNVNNNNSILTINKSGIISTKSRKISSSSSSSLTTATESKSISVSKSAMPAKSNSIIIDDEYKSDIHNNCSNTRCNKNDSVVINNEFYDDGVFNRRGDECNTNGNGGGVSNDGAVYSINLNKNKENPFNNNNNNNNSIIKTIESPHENINISVNDDDDDVVVNNENTNCEKFFITKNLLLNDFWKNNKKHINDTNNADVIYENLCKNCGYGVFEAKGKYCNFCEFTLTGNLIDYSSYNKNVEKDKIRLTDEIILQDTDERNNDAENEKQQQHTNNIYENVCDRCGEIYNNNEECDVCKRNFFKKQQEYSICYNENNNNKNNKKTTEIIIEEKYEKGKLIDEDEVVLEVEDDEVEKEQLKIKKKSSKKTKNLFNGLFDTIKKVRSRNDNNNRNSSINISESNINNNMNKNKNNNNNNNYEIKNNGSNSFSISGSSSSNCSRSNSSKNNKLKKLNIIHNVDGYDNVFRTQETFDLNYICELKRLQSSNSDQHIYGKLRNGKSDDQLLLSSSSSSSSAAAIFMNNSSDTNSNCSSIINNNNNINNNNASNNDNNNQKLKMVTGCLKKLNENGNSKSDSTLNRLQSFVVRSSASVNDDGYTVKVNRTPFHQIRSLNRLRRQQQQQRQRQPQHYQQQQQKSVHRQQKTDQLKFFIQEHVIEWMTSLRHQIHDYNNCLVNDSICSIKSIPSRNFSCCGLLNEIGSDILLSSLSSTSIITTTKKATKTEATPILTSQSFSSAFTLSAATGENEEEATLKSLFINSNDLDYTHMVDNFKRNLMEKQRFKRKAIYLKIDDRNNENNDISCSRSRSSTIDSLNSTLLHSSSSSYSNNNNSNNYHNLSNNRNSVNNRRYGIYENKDSDFVSDLLNAFDTFLKRDQANQNDHHPEVLCDNKIIEFKNNNDIGINNNNNNESNEKISVPNSITEIVPFNNKLSNHNDNNGINDKNVTETTLFVTDPLVFIKNFNIYDLIENLCLSCSLNRVLITYDRYLKEFLRAINTEQKFATCEFSQLFEIFHNLCIEQNSKFNQYNRLKKRRLKNEQNKIIIDDRTLSTDLTLLTSQTAKAIELSLLPQSPVTTVQLLPLPPPRISSHSSLKITAGTDTEIQSKDEDDIYQPIWKFKTVGNPRESYVSENESEYYLYDTRSVCNDSSKLNAEDHGEWETDDEFMFSSTKIKERTATAASLSSDSECRSMTSTIISGSSKSLFGSVSVGGGSISGGSISGVNVNINPYYRNVYIIYSLTEPKIRAIFYDYDSIKSHIILGQSAKVHNVETVVDIGRSGCVTRLSQRLLQQQQRIRMVSKSPASARKDDSKSYRNELIPDCVQAWKYMLLDTFYLDDEEDMYISEDEILKLKQIEQEKVNGSTLQRFKSVSSDNLLDIPQDKKSLSERFRNKLQRGVLKLNRSPKAKKGKPFPKRSDSTSLYLEDGVKPKYPIFGATLNDVEKDEINMNVPKFVVDCIEFIEMKDCIQSDGLYRASGNKLAIDDLKKKLSESFVYDCQFFKNQDVHTITGLLKLFFRELKTPLIPSDIYLKLPDNLIDANNIPIIRKVLQQIPNPSKGTLQYLVKHLTVVAHYSSENRMPASNLAIIWGPCILFSVSTNPFDIARMNTLTKVLIENYDEIFANNERLIN